MTQNHVLTVAELAKFVGVTPSTVYNDEKRGVVHAALNDPKRFTDIEVTDYRFTKVEQFFERMEKFRGRTKVNTVALAAAFEIDPSLFCHWKRGTQPLGATLLLANQMLRGTDREVVKRIIDKLEASHLGHKGVAMLEKLSKIFSGLQWLTRTGKVLFDQKALSEQTEAEDLAEKAKAVEAEKGQHKRKREYTSNVLEIGMRHSITDWMYSENKSNSYVARMLGVSSCAVAGWLRGKPINMPNLIKVEALCREQDIMVGENEVSVDIVKKEDYVVVEDDDVDDDIEDEDDFEDEDGEKSAEVRDGFLLRRQELTLDFLEAQKRLRSTRRLLMEYLEQEVEDDSF